MTDRPDQTGISRQHVRVLAPARLHLGFVDLNGSQGRHFGSLGLGIEELGVEVVASAAERLEISGPAAARAADYAQRFLQHHGLGGGAKLSIESAIPAHSGLGSGTQLALAVGKALAELHGVDTSIQAIAALLDRGNRSGIGIGTFTSGGFIVDAGRGGNTLVPPVISRQHFPDAWRLVLIMDRSSHGISGTPEREAFANLTPMPVNTAERISWLVLMQVLPALAETDCALFGRAVTEIQQHIGDHFAPVQGGRYTSPDIARATAALQSAGAYGIGQSSWGPTGFALFASETAAHQAVREVREQLPALAQLEWLVCRGRNQPAEVETGMNQSTDAQTQLRRFRTV